VGIVPTPPPRPHPPLYPKAKDSCPAPGTSSSSKNFGLIGQNKEMQEIKKNKNN
tara:strand:- start:112 stop:273 length:162 start_codon:yes stop_codon:yes gene_type:complete